MISTSGIIKRGLAATAISALAVTGIPALAGIAHAAVGTVTVTALPAYDIDEFAGAPDDITVTVKETGGTPTPAGQVVEFSHVFTPEVGPAAPATPFTDGGTTVGATGVVPLDFHPAAVGTYKITVRTKGSQIAAAPVTVIVGESEIAFADGNSASSPVNGTDTYTATLALTDAAKTPLVGRAVEVDLGGAGDANFGPQTAPSVRVDANEATSVTGADGTFTVSLNDPAVVPPALPVVENHTLTATATALKGVGDLPASDATDVLAVTFESAPVVTGITVTQSDVFSGVRGPGKPVELNVVVQGQAVADATPADDPILQDYPVAFAVDKGFLTPDTQGADLNVTPADLDLTADQDDKGDLFGFYENLGTTETVDSSDGPGDNAAGIVATIEKDAGFNDDGRVAQTVTVTAGGKSATVKLDYDVRNYLNLVAAAFRRDGGSTTVPGSVDLKLYASDQYVNLIGDQPASISDDTPLARVTEEGNGADTDFINDNPAATASSSQKVRQTITASINSYETLVDVNGAPDENDTVVSATHVIDWTGAGPKPPTAIIARLQGANNGARSDKLTVTAPVKANGAVVRLFKVIRGALVPAGTATLRNGRASFVKADNNGRGFTTYVAQVQRTSDTKSDGTNRRNVR